MESIGVVEEAAEVSVGEAACSRLSTPWKTASLQPSEMGAE
jgi:hypothetical protein